MAQSDVINRQLILVQRPTGEPTPDTLSLVACRLSLVEADILTAGDKQMLLRTQYPSLDPYMRGRMSDAPSYAPPIAIGEVMVGATVAQVVVSHVPGFTPDDHVLSFNGWQDYAVSDGTGVTNLRPSPERPSWALGVLGMPGFTAWAGQTQISAPQAGEAIARWLPQLDQSVPLLANLASCWAAV